MPFSSARFPGAGDNDAMIRDNHEPAELTPEGGLGEGGIHGLLGYQLAQAAILTTTAFDSVVGKPLRLRPVEFTILQLVHENAPVTASKLAKALGVTAPGVTIWLDRLEQRGLVKRERNETDRRTQNVCVTRKGAQHVTDAIERLLQADREMLKHLSEGERHMLLELLHKVARLRKR
jgi:DNA-binding MarR family transcriptional regulator